MPPSAGMSWSPVREPQPQTSPAAKTIPNGRMPSPLRAASRMTSTGRLQRLGDSRAAQRSATITAVKSIVECTVGRLIEIRIGDVRTAEEVLATRGLFAAMLERMGPRPVVIAADYRGINILDPAAAAEFLENFKFGTSTRVDRSALLVDPARATFMLQVERLIRESNTTLRKTFRNPAELEAWLADVLTFPRASSAHEFLAHP